MLPDIEIEHRNCSECEQAEAELKEVVRLLQHRKQEDMDADTDCRYPGTFC